MNLRMMTHKYTHYPNLRMTTYYQRHNPDQAPHRNIRTPWIQTFDCGTRGMTDEWTNWGNEPTSDVSRDLPVIAHFLRHYPDQAPHRNIKPREFKPLMVALASWPTNEPIEEMSLRMMTHEYTRYPDLQLTTHYLRHYPDQAPHDW